MNPTRRDLAVLLPALAAATASAQEKKTLPSKVFRYEDLPSKPNGPATSHDVMIGDTHSGYTIDLHFTELPAGQAPHAPHHHVHEELVLLHQGNLDVNIKGVITRATAGAVLYMASNDEHGWRNPGPGAAHYAVIALGRDDA